MEPGFIPFMFCKLFIPITSDVATVDFSYVCYGCINRLLERCYILVYMKITGKERISVAKT